MGDVLEESADTVLVEAIRRAADGQTSLDLAVGGRRETRRSGQTAPRMPPAEHPSGDHATGAEVRT